MIKQAPVTNVCPDLADLVVYLLLAQTGFLDHFLIKNGGAIIGNRAKAAFGAEGQRDFTGNNQVEFSAKCQGETKCDRDTPVGNAQHYHGPTGIFSQFFGKLSPGVITVFKDWFGSRQSHTNHLGSSYYA